MIQFAHGHAPADAHEGEAGQLELTTLVADSGAADYRQPARRCRSCPSGARAKLEKDFPLRHGKPGPDCYACCRRKWTESRRARLKDRQCARCKARKPFDQFRERERGGRAMLGMLCIPCEEARDAERRAAAERADAARRAAKAQTAGLLAVLDHLVPGARRVPAAPPSDCAASGPDFTRLAQQALYPDRPAEADYFRLTREEKHRLFAFARALARRFSPAWPGEGTPPDERGAPRSRVGARARSAEDAEAVAALAALLADPSTHAALPPALAALLAAATAAAVRPTPHTESTTPDDRPDASDATHADAPAA